MAPEMIMKSLSRHISEGLLTGSAIDISNPGILDLLEIMYNDPSAADFQRAYDMMKEMLRMKYVSERTDRLRTVGDMYDRLGDNVWICMSPNSMERNFAIITKETVLIWNFSLRSSRGKNIDVIVAKGNFISDNKQHMMQINRWVHVFERMYNLGPISKKANKELADWMKNKVSDSKTITISQ